MARISFLILPEPGHLLPVLTLGKILQNRSHDVCYITAPGFRDFILSKGFRFHGICWAPHKTSDISNILFTQETGEAFRMSLRNQMSVTGTALPELLAPDLLVTEPDILVCDSSLLLTFPYQCGKLAHELAQRVKIKMVCLATSLPDMTRYPYELPLQEIILCPIEFEIPEAFVPICNRFYCEPSFGSDSGSSVALAWTSTNDERPLVYCSFGTQHRTYPHASAILQRIIEAFALIPEYRLVVAHGGLINSAEIEVPQNVLLVESAPQSRVLKHTQLAITHGGLGSIKEIIRTCIPMLIVPFVWDQLANAARVEYHGLGRKLAGDCSPEQIRRLIMEIVSDGRMHVNLQAMSSIFHAAEEHRPSVHLLETVGL